MRKPKDPSSGWRCSSRAACLPSKGRVRDLICSTTKWNVRAIQGGRKGRAAGERDGGREGRKDQTNQEKLAIFFPSDRGYCSLAKHDSSCKSGKFE